jgi:hypothetical protein
MIAQNTDSKSKYQNPKGHEAMPANSLEKFGAA